MPAYCYTTDDGEVVERVYPMGKAPRKIKLRDGRTANRNFAVEHSAPVPTTDACWPLYSRALGVPPESVAEHTKFFADRGIPCEFKENKHGMYDMKLNSRQHRRQVLRAVGMHDRDGGYGD